MTEKEGTLQSFWDWPTSTVKGALVVAIIAGIGGFLVKGCFETKSQPKDLVEASSADSSYSWALDVDEVFVTYDDLRKLDSVSFFVDRRHGFAAMRPTGKHARVEEESLPSFYEGLSPSTIPFFGHLARSFQRLASTDRPAVGDIATARLLSGGKMLIEFLDHSMMGKLPLSYNPLKDPELSNASESMLTELLGSDISALVSEAAPELKSQSAVERLLDKAVDSAIDRKAPSLFEFSPGITVKSFSKSYLATSPPARVTGDGSELTGFGYFVLLQLLNPELAAFGLSSLDTSKDGNVLMYDSSVLLRRIRIDGHLHERVELVKIFVVIDSRDFVHAVRLQYLNGLISRDQEIHLERSLGSLKVAR